MAARRRPHQPDLAFRTCHKCEQIVVLLPPKILSQSWTVPPAAELAHRLVTTLPRLCIEIIAIAPILLQAKGGQSRQTNDITAGRTGRKKSSALRSSPRSALGRI